MIAKRNSMQNLQILILMSFMDLKLKYQSSALGFFWSFLKPLLQFVVYYTIFGKILHVGQGSDYALKLFFGVIIWAWFAESTGLGLSAFIGKKSIISKIKINRILVPLAAFLTPTMNYFLNFLIFFVIYLWILPIHPVFDFFRICLIFYSLFCISLFIITCNLLIANLNVFFRDMQPIWELVLMYGVFLTPVIYQIPLKKNMEIYYYSINLLAFPLVTMKSAFFAGSLTFDFYSPIFWSYNTVLLLEFGLALLVHFKLSKHVADYL